MPEVLSGTVPRGVPLSKKVTRLPGVAPLPVTAARRVTEAPTTAGLGEAERMVEVVACWTMRLRVSVLGRLLLSPA